MSRAGVNGRLLTYRRLWSSARQHLCSIHASLEDAVCLSACSGGTNYCFAFPNICRLFYPLTLSRCAPGSHTGGAFLISMRSTQRLPYILPYDRQAPPATPPRLPSSSHREGRCGAQGFPPLSLLSGLQRGAARGARRRTPIGDRVCEVI